MPNGVNRVRKPELPGIDLRAARITWTAALTLLLMGLIYSIRSTLVLFVVAVMFAYLLYPLVVKVSDQFAPKHRATSLAITYLVVIGILGSLMFLLGSQVASQARQLISHPPDVKSFLAKMAENHPALAPALNAAQGRIQGQIGDMLSSAPRYGLDVIAASANLIGLVVIPILSFFMVKDAAYMKESFLELFPGTRTRYRVERTLNEIHEVLLNYMRALLLLCCNVLVVFAIVLSVMGVQYALLLSSIAFLCEFVPLLGPLVAAILILAASALTGFPHLVWVFGFLAGFRLMQDYFISPRLMGAGVELHPLVVIFGVFAGGEIGGAIGVFLSIPVLALARLAVKRANG